MVETHRLQAKQIFNYREESCHSPHKRGIQFKRHSGESRNPGKMGLGILDAGSC
jgi:hypothetical protein